MVVTKPADLSGSTPPSWLRERNVADRIWPGLLVAVIAGVGAVLAHAVVEEVSALVVAIVIGVVLGNMRDRVDVLRPGLAAAAKAPLRLGVVFLGFRLSIGQVFELGLPTLLLVFATVSATFFGTQALGRRMGLSPSLSLLVGTGFSICGASAIAAMEPASNADEEEVAMSIGLVTLAGTAAMFTLPLLAGVLGLSDVQFGTWVGASVHDVAQVVAAGSAGGPAVLSVAVVVKLTRVVLLAPTVAGVNLWQATRGGVEQPSNGAPLVPMFVAGFLATMAIRSTGMVPQASLDLARSAEGLLFAVALVGLGSGVRIARLRQLGVRPLLLGALAWMLVASVSLVGAVLVAR